MGDDSVTTTVGATGAFGTSAIVDAGHSSLGDDDVVAEPTGQVTWKDPRKIARKYQLDLCKKALEENVIVYLETGCGKTHIAVLLMFEMRHLIKKPQNNVSVFLAPTVALAHQQAKVIEDATDFNVGIYCGDANNKKSHEEWGKELTKYEVLVMTPQILLRCMCHCFIRMETIVLLIFDECHYAQLDSNHPYAEIMKVFYDDRVAKVPRIFGMTASPILGKGASIDSLETLLHAKICTVEDKEELENFITSPAVRVYFYNSNTTCSSSSSTTCLERLEESKLRCRKKLHNVVVGDDSLKRVKRSLERLHNNLVFCLESLGIWGVLQASRVLLIGGQSELNDIKEVKANPFDDCICNDYLDQAASLFKSYIMRDSMESELSTTIVLQEPFFSKKLLCLIGILSDFRSRPDMKCIIFVSRIVVARSLSYILQHLKILASWRCNFLVGVHSESMSRRSMNNILEQFCSGELNLLVATKAGEEGLDIQTCCIVIRFDLPETVASFIQSRGRARMPQSEYVFLVDSDNQRELETLKHFKENENQMNMEIVSRKSCGTITQLKEKVYTVDATGATISSQTSISLFYHYCSKLPRDEYFNPKPHLYYIDDVEGTVCHIILPSNAPIHRVGSAPQSSMEAAKGDACLKACKYLHEMGALNDYLLPDQNDTYEDLDLGHSDSDSDDDESSKRDLYEVLVPAVLKQPWSNTEASVCLNSYFVRFTPVPCDRQYKEFGIFIKVPLPSEAERMKLELHLAHGRSVMTELLPSGVAEFNQEEMALAQNFQEMFLKIILERSEFVHNFVALDEYELCISKSPAFYLLLPVIRDEFGVMNVDWEIIRRCLSSPIFNTKEVLRSNLTNNDHLQLYDGPTRVNDVVNSLVYADHKKSFFFVSQILHEKNAYSFFSGSTSHADHLSDTFNIHLNYPKQPLLRAKQLFRLRNLLHDRKKENSESTELEEHFFELPSELCQLKIIGFSKEIGSSLSLLPSIMSRLESLLVAIELKDRLSNSFPEGAEVTAERVLEALTTAKCNERFSLERLEVLGDVFLKFAVGRHLFLAHQAMDEGQLTRRRSKMVNNLNLFRLAITRNLQAYIRDKEFDPSQFYALGRACSILCSEETKSSIHSRLGSGLRNCKSALEITCSKNHHSLRQKTVADVVEALIGAYIVDSGFKAAAAFLKWIGIQVDYQISQVYDACMTSASFLSLASSTDIARVESILGYQFLHRGLLLQAVVHPSYNRHGGGCYQRLEFLGDAALDYLITSYLYSAYPDLTPGQLTDMRSVLVNNNIFGKVAVGWSLHKLMISDSSNLSDAIDKYADYVALPASESGLLEDPPCPKALGDVVESSIGAVLLDTGFDLNRTWKVMHSFLELDRFTGFSNMQLNPVRELRELCQSYHWKLDFAFLKKNNCFTVEAKVDGKSFCSTASSINTSKKAATRKAAKKIFTELQSQGYKVKTPSLEETLKASCKMEAKLIGFDETPTVAVTFQDSSTACQNLRLHEAAAACESEDGASPESQSLQSTNRCSSSIKSASFPSRVQRSTTGRPPRDKSRRVGSENGGPLHKATARSLLYEICAANCWNTPLFHCCAEEGPSHLKLFTFKVVLEIDEEAYLTFESIGEPRLKKKAAAEQAAETAVWVLKKTGYI